MTYKEKALVGLQRGGSFRAYSKKKSKVKVSKS